MSTTSLFTADELLALPTGMGKRYELVAGELRVMSPSGWPHGRIVGRLHNRLGPFIESHGLGEVFGAETGFRVTNDPDTVLAPDIAYISRKRLLDVASREGFWPGAPDLAVEVLSPGDRMSEVGEKIAAWLAAGCGAVWIVDPKLQTVTIYGSPNDVRVFAADQTFSGDPVVPGFSCAVSDLFH